LEKEKQDILEKAFSESYEKAKKEVEEKLQSQSVDLLKAINSVEKAKKDLIGKERDDILKLAVHAAEYMTRRQLEVSEDAFDDIIKEALDRVTDKDKVILRVAKEDVDRVRKKIDKFLEFMPDIKTLEVHKDAHQTPGGCIIETKLGYVDTSMDIKLEALEKAIVETYKEEHPEQFETSSPVVDSESSEASAASDSATEPAPK
jgi:flagellar biosynthesis/type III secretory pathway protein FliH